VYVFNIHLMQIKIHTAQYYPISTSITHRAQENASGKEALKNQDLREKKEMAGRPTSFTGRT